MNRKTKIFLALSLSSTIVAAVFLVLPWTRDYQRHMFFASGGNFFGDFFNCVMSLSLFDGFNPYHNGVISTVEQIYPPFAYVSLLPFAAFFPDTVRSLSNCYTSPVAMTCCAVMALLMMAAIAYACVACCRRFRLSPCVTIALLFSGLVLFALERGNLVVFAVAGIAVFLCHYDSEKFSNRLLAVAGLSLAVSLKVTPVLFGVLWLNKKDFKYLAAAGLLTVTASFLPLFSSDYSILENVRQLISNTMTHERDYAEWSVSINPSCVLNAGVRLLGLPFAFAVPILKYVSLLLGVVGLCLAMKRPLPVWERFFLLAAAQVLIPSAPQPYVALFFIPALIAFLDSENESNTHGGGVFMLIFLVLTTPIQLFVLRGWSMNFAFVSAAISIGAFLIILRHMPFLPMRKPTGHKE